MLAAGLSLRTFTKTPSEPKTPERMSVRPAEQSFDISPTPISSSSPAVNRSLFPYSVIPGGAHSALDLRNAVRNDPVVAAHYEDFDVTKAHIASLEQDRLVYVSYRIADHVFWTSKKLMLPKGETVITDGTHEARTRCGNRISETPAGPISKEEPSAEMLGKIPEGDRRSTTGPDPERTVNQPLSLPRTFAELLPESLSPPSDLSALATSIPGTSADFQRLPGFFFPGIVGGPTSGSLSSSKSSGSTSGDPGNPIIGPVASGPPSTPLIPVATPEPSSLLLLSGGLVAVWVRKARNRQTD